MLYTINLLCYGYSYIPIKELLDMQAEKLGIDRTLGWAELEGSEEMDL